MLEFDASGLSRLRKDIEAAGNLPDSVLKEMVTAQAKVTEEALVYYAAQMLKGGGKRTFKRKGRTFFMTGVNYSTGDTVRSITRKKPHMYRNGPQVRIQFEGEQHGNRNAEVAFVNEYGKKSQPARPFIKTAIRESLTPAAEAAREILNEHIKSKNL